ncbi:MAG: DedA family protein [Pacificimonas sp.]
MTEWIEGLIADLGYLGIGFLMFLENLFPPIPSEVIMPLAGYAAAQQDGLSLTGVILAGSIGSLVGMAFWYWVGLKFSEERLRAFVQDHGRWLTIKPKELDRIDRWFDGGGRWAVFLGRCVPTIRTLISVPAGLFAMPLPTFLALTFAGVAIWDAGLAWIGYSLGDGYTVVDQWLGPVSIAITAAIVLGYLWRLATYRVD